MTSAFQDRPPQTGRELDPSRSRLIIIYRYCSDSRQIQVLCPPSAGVLPENEVCHHEVFRQSNQELAADSTCTPKVYA